MSTVVSLLCSSRFATPWLKPCPPHHCSQCCKSFCPHTYLPPTPGKLIDFLVRALGLSAPPLPPPPPNTFSGTLGTGGTTPLPVPTALPNSPLAGVCILPPLFPALQLPLLPLLAGTSVSITRTGRLPVSKLFSISSFSCAAILRSLRLRTQ